MSTNIPSHLFPSIPNTATTAATMDETNSILSFIGSELIGVITPVSICMFIVVLLIFSLYSPSSPKLQIVTVANLVYSESASDSTAVKLTGAIENATVAVLIIAAVTFLLVLLYYFNFTNFLKYYIRFSTFVILLAMGGAIVISIVKHFDVGVDSVSFVVFMVNFAVVGVVAVLGGGGVPILVTQGYTVMLGVITAATFTQLPEWTTWVLLVALAIYDLVAVLVPGGPLKILVELAQTRNDDLPALVYESRPRVRVSENSGVELQNLDRNENSVQNLDRNENSVQNADRNENAMQNADRNENAMQNEDRNANSERVPLAGVRRRGDEDEDEDGEETRIGGIKLGLGDFVFYSVLVGRAAMYDLMTVYACYLAIISGLACTLILLSVARRALPALPISIVLGVCFYFLTRLLMEPFVVHVSANLLMF